MDVAERSFVTVRWFWSPQRHAHMAAFCMRLREVRPARGINTVAFKETSEPQRHQEGLRDLPARIAPRRCTLSVVWSQKGAGAHEGSI